MSSSKSFFEEKRTWSRIKDEVLKTYLAPYLAKVSKTKRPIIVADCFAGKGRFDNGEPGYPVIIAEAISHQLNDSPTPEIKGIFIEMEYFDKSSLVQDRLINSAKNKHGKVLQSGRS